MLIRFFKRITDHPWIVILVILGISVVFIWKARPAILDENLELIIDTSLDNYISRSSDTYEFFLRSQEAFGGDNSMVLAIQPPANETPGLSFFLKMRDFSERLKEDVPGVAEVVSAINVPQHEGGCLGKTYFHQEVYGSFCESVLEYYRKAEVCWKSPTAIKRETPAEKISGRGGAELEISEEEEPLFFDDNPAGDTEPGGEQTSTEPGGEQTSTEPGGEQTSTEPGGEQTSTEPGGEDGGTTAGVFSPDSSVECTPDIYKKSLEKIRSESETAVGEIFLRLKENPLILGDLISRDFSTFGLILTFGERVSPHQENIQEAIAKLVNGLRKQGLPAHYSGQPRQQYQASATLRKDIRTILPISLLIMILVLIITFQSLRGVLIPFSVVTLGLIWTAGVFSIAGETINPVTIVLAPLLVCVGSAYVIFFMNQYFSAAIEHRERAVLVEETLKKVTIPLSVTALTTIAGFGALMISPIPAIKTLGLYAGVGIAAIIFITLTLVPSFLRILPPPKETRPENSGNKLLDRFLAIISEFVGRHSRKLIFFWIGIGIVAFAGLLQMEVNSESTAFGENTPIMKDLRFIEKHLGGGNLLRIVMFNEAAPDQLATADTMRKLAKMERSLLSRNPESPFRKIPGLRIDRIYSPVAYLKLRYGDLATLTNLEVSRYLEQVKKQGGPRFFSPNGEWLQVSLRIKTTGSTPFLQLREILDKNMEDWVPGFGYRFTGTGILASESADNIAKSQIQSVALALIIIFCIMSILFLSPKMGLLALYPNIVTIMIFFGTLGWLNIPLGVTISVIAAIALGIGVDDTIHYLAHYNSNVKILRNEKQAAVATVRQIGRPMVSTTFALALGFLAFIFSEMDTQYLFGSLLAFTLFVCLFTDLNFLPSIMARTRLITAWDYLNLGYSPESIANIPLFHNMSMRETKLATLMSYPLEREKGEIVFEEGDIGKELFVIVEGSVEVYFDSKYHEQEQVLATLEVGAAFGEMGLFRQSQRIASVRAVEKSRLLVLNQGVLEKLQARYPKIAAKLFLNLATNLSTSIRRTDQQFIDKVSAKSAREEYLRSTHSTEAELIAAIKEIVADGLVTPDERRALESRVYADGHLSGIERKHLDRLDRLISSGKVKEKPAIFNGMLHNLGHRHTQWIKLNFLIKRYAPGESVWRQNSEVRDMHLLLKGRLNLVQNIAGKEVNLHTVFDGDLIGEETVLFNEYTRNDRLTVLEPSQILFISAEGIEKIIRLKSRLAAQFTYNLVCMLSDRLQEANKKLYN